MMGVEVWRDGCERGAGGQATARGERPTEETGGRPQPRQGHAAIGNLKKLTGLVERRAEVRRLKEEFPPSERRVRELMEIPRMNYRYQSRRDDSVLREHLLALAREKDALVICEFNDRLGTTNTTQSDISPWIQQNYRPVIAVHKWFARRPGTLFRA